ncbi:hypothetical protein GO986_12175 [Deinococcus sp. HMF7620]|uniref:Uncharacterized protein n=1 Tax=Deinococcus arboris TaxID=2682977 RepID=A0A7C9M2G3_9DEIO|nr:MULTISPECIES: hypothetical protein [Deinococcus]MBZ9752126.1 hypothetical protein [Deinococcus betulae]MVN87522.1 hypothetical protein [Deinococcus arboris]
MLVHAAPATVHTHLSREALSLNVRPLAAALAQRDLMGTTTTVLEYVLSAVQASLRALPYELEAVLDLYDHGGQSTLRLQLHYDPQQTFTALSLGPVRKRLHRIHPQVLPAFLRRASLVGLHGLPLFTPTEALGLYSQNHLCGAESDDDFADNITDFGIWDAPPDLPREEALALARQKGLRTFDDVQRLVPAFDLHLSPEMPGVTLPTDVQALHDQLCRLEAQVKALPPYTDAECEASCEPLWPYFRESLLVDPFPTATPRLSFTREMQGELGYFEGDCVPVRTFLLADSADLDRLDQYLQAVPDLQRGLRQWLTDLSRLRKAT